MVVCEDLGQRFVLGLVGVRLLRVSSVKVIVAVKPVNAGGTFLLKPFVTTKRRVRLRNAI